MIEREDRGRGAQLGPHVGDRPFTGATDGVGAGPEVLHDLVGPALHRQQAADVQDDVLGRGPPAQLAGQPDADQLGVQHFPGQPCHHLAGVRASHADRQHPQPAAVRRMRVGADDQRARERVIFQHDLMDDAGPRLPESDPVFLRRRREEVVDFLILIDRAKEILLGAGLGSNQVVAMDRAGDRHLLLSGLHELQHRHLRRRVLHGDAVGAQGQHGLAPFPDLRVEIIGMRDQDLLAQRQRATECLPRFRQLLRHRGVQFFGYFD